MAKEKRQRNGIEKHCAILKSIESVSEKAMAAKSASKAKKISMAKKSISGISEISSAKSGWRRDIAIYCYSGGVIEKSMKNSEKQWHRSSGSGINGESVAI